MILLISAKPCRNRRYCRYEPFKTWWIRPKAIQMDFSMAFVCYFYFLQCAYCSQLYTNSNDLCFFTLSSLWKITRKTQLNDYQTEKQVQNERVYVGKKSMMAGFVCWYQTNMKEEIRAADNAPYTYSEEIEKKLSHYYLHSCKLNEE